MCVVVDRTCVVIVIDMVGIVDDILFADVMVVGLIVVVLVVDGVDDGVHGRCHCTCW